MRPEGVVLNIGPCCCNVEAVAEVAPVFVLLRVLHPVGHLWPPEQVLFLSKRPMNIIAKSVNETFILDHGCKVHGAKPLSNFHGHCIYPHSSQVEYCKPYPRL